MERKAKFDAISAMFTNYVSDSPGLFYDSLLKISEYRDRIGIPYFNHD